MSPSQDAQYQAAAAAFGPALSRLARATEADTERRRDLLQDMHVALWRSFAAFDGRCSLSTWVHRIAHNVATSHVLRERRQRGPLLTLDDIAEPAGADPVALVEERDALARLYALIRTLKQPDRDVVTLYLEGLDATAIAEITGLSANAIALRMHRVKAFLARTFQEAEHV